MLFLDARNYYTVVDRTLNEWSEWQLKNLNAIVWLYRGEIEKYKVLLQEYYQNITVLLFELDDVFRDIPVYSDPIYTDTVQQVKAYSEKIASISVLPDCFEIKEYVDRIYMSWKQNNRENI